MKMITDISTGMSTGNACDAVDAIAGVRFPGLARFAPIGA